MLGILEEGQKSDWKSYVPPLVWCMHTTRLAMKVPLYICAPSKTCLDIKQGIESSDKSRHVCNLKTRLEFAYKHQGRRVGKTGDIRPFMTWKFVSPKHYRRPCLVVMWDWKARISLPTDGRKYFWWWTSQKRYSCLHSLDTSLLIDGNQPSPADTSSIIDNTCQVDLSGTSSGDAYSSAATDDAVYVPASSFDKYVIPQKRSTLNLCPNHLVHDLLTLHNQGSYLWEPGDGICGKHPGIRFSGRVFIRWIIRFPSACLWAK